MFCTTIKQGANKGGGYCKHTVRSVGIISTPEVEARTFKNMRLLVG
jgi:hypothetical protein